MYRLVDGKFYSAKGWRWSGWQVPGGEVCEFPLDRAFIDIAWASCGSIMGLVSPVTLMIWCGVRRGQVAPLAGGPLGPASVVVRVALLCAATTLLLGLPAARLLAILTSYGARFVLFKSVYGAIIVPTVTPSSSSRRFATIENQRE